MAAPDLSPLPLTPATWERVAARLGLSPQQRRIVELVLRNACDKEIEAALGLRHATLRTYFTRIFTKLDVSDRLGLVLLVMRLSHEQTVVMR